MKHEKTLSIQSTHRKFAQKTKKNRIAFNHVAQFTNDLEIRKSVHKKYKEYEEKLDVILKIRFENQKEYILYMEILSFKNLDICISLLFYK